MTKESHQIINGVLIDDGLLLLEPRKHLDSAICKVENGRVVYKEYLLIEGYRSMGMDYEEALTWIDYNSDRHGIFYGGTKDLLSPRIEREEREEREEY